MDTTLCPPPLIFNFSYGSAALAAWGMDEFQTFARNQTTEYYPDAVADLGDVNGGNGDGYGDNVDADGDRVNPPDCHEDQMSGSKDGATRKLSARDWRTAKRDKPRRSTEHQGKCREHDTMDLVMGLWMRNRRVNQGQRHDVEDVDRVRDRVEAWLPSVVR
jgi:hypothetical protein